MNYKIKLNNIQIFGHHGVLPFEKEKGQYFELDIEIILPLNKKIVEDDLNLGVPSKIVMLFFSKFLLNEFS